MRRTAAALTDVAATGIMSYVAFRLADAQAPCSPSGSCAALTPLTLLLALLFVGGYYVGGYALWRKTPGQAALRIPNGA